MIVNGISFYGDWGEGKGKGEAKGPGRFGEGRSRNAGRVVRDRSFARFAISVFFIFYFSLCIYLMPFMRNLPGFP